MSASKILQKRFQAAGSTRSGGTTTFLKKNIFFTYIIEDYLSKGTQILYDSWLDVVFRQIEIVLKDSTAFVYVTKSEKSSHFKLMT